MRKTRLVSPRPRRAARVWSVLACVLCALNVVFVHAAGLEIGWAERDITPSLDGGKKIPLAGQYYVRDATNIHSRLKVTCCVMRNGDEQVLMGSVDVVGLWDPPSRADPRSPPRKRLPRQPPQPRRAFPASVLHGGGEGLGGEEPRPADAG